MAQTGYTPISIYYSATATNTPTAGNLVAGELAINTNDGVLYYKDSSGVVQSIASKAGNSGSFTNLAYTGTLTGGTGIVNLGSGQFYKDASGNVGIGTTTPDIFTSGNRVLGLYTGSGVAQMQISGSTAARIDFGLGTTRYGVLYQDSTNFMQLGTITSLPLVFNTANTERMRIDSSGNLLVGTTSTLFSTCRFSMSSAVNGAGFITSAGSGYSPVIVQRTASTGDLIQFVNQAGSTVIGSVNTTTNTSVLYNVTSDYRLKNVIGVVTNSGQRIDALEPIEYDWKAGGRTRGFLAHQFAEIYPNSVSGQKDAVDKNGKPVYQGMQPSTPEVMADLIAEIQSLRKRIATLEAK